MSRPTLHLCRAALAALAAGALLAACAGGPATLSDIRYDLGPLETQTGSASLPALKVPDVNAPPTLDNDDFMYRLGYASQRSARYANSRWLMSPARLLTQRLRSALSAHATVLTGVESVPAPILRIDLDQFEQVFDSPTESSGVLSARATLIQDGKVIGQRTFLARAPAATPDAAGGARALAAASDQLVSQIAAWLSVQAFAGTP